MFIKNRDTEKDLMEGDEGRRYFLVKALRFADDLAMATCSQKGIQKMMYMYRTQYVTNTECN